MVQSSVHKNKQAKCAFFLFWNYWYKKGSERKTIFNEYYAKSGNGNCPNWKNNLSQVT